MVTLAGALARRGHAISCFVYYPEMDHYRGVLDEAGVRVFSTQKLGRLGLRVPRELRKLIRQGFDICLSYLTTPNVYTVLSTLGTRTASVVSERSALPAGRIGLGVRARFESYRLADRVLVNSEHHREDLGEVFPWMRSKLVTIRNGVDLLRYRLPDQPRTARERHLNLLAVGGIYSNKNVIGLIEALQLHRDRVGWTPSVRWAGRRGTQMVHVRAFEQAEQLIDRYGLRSNWEWLGVRRDVPDLMRAADALIHPSFYEGLPNVICEALASGLPVLAGRVCDHPWLVGNDERGLLFNPSDSSDMALTIQQFSTLSQDEREAMSGRARRFAEQELSLEKLTNGYEELFREVIGPILESGS